MTTDASSDARASAYARIKYRLLIIDLVWSLAVLWLAAPWSLVFTRLEAVAAMAPWLRVAVYGAVFAAAYSLVNLPLTYYSGHHLEHRFGLSTQTFLRWVGRQLKMGAVGLVIFLLLLEGLYAILRADPHTWWLWATLGWVGFSVVLARVTPTLLVPLFYQCRPLADRALAERLMALVQRAGLSAMDAFAIDFSRETKKANAALVGMGATRRILVTDTMLGAYSHEEIEAVLAHELGHHRHHHITQLLGISAVTSLAGLLAMHWWLPRQLASRGIDGLADVAGFPVLAFWLTLLGVLLMPLQNAFSRRLERQADRFSLELTRRPQPFISMMRKLGEQNLADPNPPSWVEWWFYDHPAIPRRIAFAESWSAR